MARCPNCRRVAMPASNDQNCVFCLNCGWVDAAKQGTDDVQNEKQ